MYRCPSAKHVDEWRETGLKWKAEFWLNASYGIKSWLFTVDHKRIALLYLASISFLSGPWE